MLAAIPVRSFFISGLFVNTEPVPYPDFWSRYTGLGAQKSSSTVTKSLFFCQTSKFFCERFIKNWTSYMLTLESSAKKTWRFHEKNMQQLCLPSQMRLIFEHATGDHSKQLRSCLYVDQNYRF